MVASVLIISGGHIGYHKARYQGGGTMHNEISQAQSTALHAKLTIAAEAGMLTEQQLSEAVRVHADSIDGLFSVGLLWMRRNAKHLSNLAFDLATFLINHLDVGDFGSSLIHSRKVLEIVPEADRALVYREAFIRCGDCNSSWIRDARQLNVSKGVIAAMILDRLQECKVDPAMNVASFVHDFLRYGAGHVERVGDSHLFEDEQYTYWGVLTNKQLAEAIEIVTEKAPSLLFEETGAGYSDVDLWLKLSMRLGDDAVKSLMGTAAVKLTSLSGISLKKLTRLSPTVQLQTARNTGGSAELAVSVALSMNTESDGDSPLTEFEPLFTEEGTLDAFRSMWAMLPQSENEASVAFIEHWLLKRLEAFGYIYGQIEWGGYFDPKLKRLIGQLEVTHEGIRYVQKLTRRNYLPKVGNWVFIQPALGEELTERATVAVPFIRAHGNEK